MRIEPVDALPPAALHAAFTRAFADYLIGPFKVELAQWPQFLARQGVDPGLSRVALASGEILAFALVAPRAQRWRLATMGAVPAARGTGAAPTLLDDFLQRAADAGLPEVELEVFAQNERALRLYRSRGFEPLHALHGYLAPPLGGLPAPPEADVQVCNREQAFAWITDEAAPRVPNLPLQVTPVALAPSTTVLQAWRCGSAQLVFSQLDGSTVAIASLIDWQPAQGDARRLVRQLRAAHPQQAIRVPQLQRIDLGGQALRDGGFEPLPLHQLLMSRPTGVLP